ncbi:histone acetyltransferase KAT6B-like [Melia azedarach]|uniref:Histone acetyltransferase KAT6B-like n=1 Tax=Melia azedarach TaxID=155640 RepID=A0ACC1Z354_MELAZ|nr:histone acetyltransferase KAT6B-like [Melia azedarach]
MATPSAHSSEFQPPNTSAHNPNMIHSEESLQSPSLPKQLKEIPQSSKTLTLEVLLPRNSNQQQESKVEEGQKQGDVEMLTPAPQPIPDHRVSTTLATINVTYSRRAPTRKKLAQQKKRAALEKKSLEKLEILKKTLKPIPFTPLKNNLDFSSHEQLLRRLGLWDFVHMEFDTNIRTDLIAQLIATYNQSSRCSYVSGSRIGVNRADLSRALKLPGKKDKINVNVNVSEGSVEIPEKESEESIKFIEEIVSNWMLLHDDMWMMPDEVLKTTKMIKEGNFEKIDLTSLVWYMVEKELLSPQLGRCYYASHMQCLIQCQKKELFLTEEVTEVVEVKEEMEVKEEVEEDCDGDVKMYDRVDDVRRNELEEHQIMLSLGQENIVDLKKNVEHSLKEDDENSLKENVESNLQENVENSSKENVENSSKENVEKNLKENVEKEEKDFVGGEDVITFQDNKNEQQLFFDEKKVSFEENRNEEEDGQWFPGEKNNVDENEHLLRRCTVDEIRGVDFEEEKNGMDDDEEDKKQEVGEEVEEDGGEHEEEAEEEAAAGGRTI